MAERKARGEVDVPSPGRSYRRIFFENVFSFINNVFYVLCLMLVFLGRPLDALLPLAVVLINAGVSVFQEVRAKRKLDEIAATAASRSSTLARSCAATCSWWVLGIRSSWMEP